MPRLVLACSAHRSGVWLVPMASVSGVWWGLMLTLWMGLATCVLLDVSCAPPSISAWSAQKDTTYRVVCVTPVLRSAPVVFALLTTAWVASPGITNPTRMVFAFLALCIAELAWAPRCAWVAHPAITWTTACAFHAVPKTVQTATWWVRTYA